MNRCSCDLMNDSSVWCWSFECSIKFCHRFWILKQMIDDCWHILFIWLELRQASDENIFEKFQSFRRFCRLTFSDDVHLKELFVKQTQMISNLIERNILLWSKRAKFRWTCLCNYWLQTSLWINDWFNRSDYN